MEEEEVLGQEQLNPITGLTGDTKSNVARDVDGINAPTQAPNLGEALAMSRTGFTPFNRKAAAYSGQQAAQAITPSRAATNPELAEISGVVQGVGYDEDYVDYIGEDANAFTQDVNEMRAEGQTAGEKLGRGVIRVIGKTGLEIGKLPGYLAAVTEIAASGFDSTVIPGAFDNFLISGLNKVEEQMNTEFIPIYARKHMTEGNFFQKMGDAEFWATSGADATGFFLSMLVPGSAIKALGVGARASRLAGQFGRVEAANIAARAGSLGGKNLAASSKAWVKANLGGRGLANNIDNILSTSIMTAGEAGMEAAETVNSLKDTFARQLLDEQYGEGWSDANPMLFEAYKEDAIAKSPEALAEIGKAGRNTFLANSALLIFPNMILSKQLGNMMGLTVGAKRKVAGTALGGVHDASGNLIKDASQLVTQTPWKEAAKSVGLAFGREGAFEEGLQLAISKASEEGASLTEDDKGLGGFIVDTFGSYINGLGTSEYWEGVMLGGLLAAPMSAVSKYREAKQYNKHIAEYQKLLTAGVDFTSKLNEAYERDAAGNIVFKKVTKADGKQYTVPKLKKDSIGKLYLEYSKQMEAADRIQAALESGDTDAALTAFLEGIFHDHALNYIQTPGGAELLKEQLKEDNSEFSELLKTMGIADKLLQQEQQGQERATTVSQKLMEYVDTVQELYNDVENYGPDFYGINNIEESEEFREFVEYKKQTNPKFSQEALKREWIEIVKYNSVKLNALKSGLEKELAFYDEFVETAENRKNSIAASAFRLSGEVTTEKIEDSIAILNEELNEVIAQQQALLNAAGTGPRPNAQPNKTNQDREFDTLVKREKGIQKLIESKTKKLDSAKVKAAEQAKMLAESRNKLDLSVNAGSMTQEDADASFEQLLRKNVKEWFAQGAQRTVGTAKLERWTSKDEQELQYYTQLKGKASQDFTKVEEGLDHIFNKNNKQEHYKTFIDSLLKARAEELKLENMAKNKEQNARAFADRMRNTLIAKGYPLIDSDLIGDNYIVLDVKQRRSFYFSDADGNIYTAVQSQKPDPSTGLYTWSYYKMAADTSSNSWKPAEYEYKQFSTQADPNRVFKKRVGAKRHALTIDKMMEFGLDQTDRVLSSDELSAKLATRLAFANNKLRKELIQKEYQRVSHEVNYYKNAIAELEQKIQDTIDQKAKASAEGMQMINEAMAAGNFSKQELDELINTLTQTIAEYESLLNTVKQSKDNLDYNMSVLIAQEGYLAKAAKEVKDLLDNPDNTELVNIEDIATELGQEFLQNLANNGLSPEQRALYDSSMDVIRKTLNTLTQQEAELEFQIREASASRALVSAIRSNVFAYIGIHKLAELSPADIASPAVKAAYNMLRGQFMGTSTKRALEAMWGTIFPESSDVAKATKRGEFNLVAANLALFLKDGGFISEPAYKDIIAQIRVGIKDYSVDGFARALKGHFNPLDSAQALERIAAAKQAAKGDYSVLLSIHQDTPVSVLSPLPNRKLLDTVFDLHEMFAQEAEKALEKISPVIADGLKRENISFAEYLNKKSVEKLQKSLAAVKADIAKYSTVAEQNTFAHEKYKEAITAMYKRLDGALTLSKERREIPGNQFAVGFETAQGFKTLAVDNGDAGYKKINMFATTTRGIKMENGKPVIVNGKKVLETDPNAVRWQNYMDNLDTTDVANMSVRMVSAKVLKDEFSVEPPVNNVEALYAIVYKGNTPVTHNGGLLFTGIAEVETVFPANTPEMKIGLWGYLRSKGVKPDQSGKITYNSKVFDMAKKADQTKLYNEVKKVLKEEYSAWRSSVLKKISEGNEVYHKVTGVSDGHAVNEETAPRKASEVFEKSEVHSVVIATTKGFTEVGRANPQGGDSEVFSILRTNTGAGNKVARYGVSYILLKNGTMVATRNLTIKDHPKKEKIKSFIVDALSLANNHQAPSLDIRLGKGNKRRSLFPVQGDNGLINELINWGAPNKNRTEASKYPIFISGKVSGRRILVFTDGNGIKHEYPIASIVDSKGTVNKASEAYKQLMKFLDTKYFHVSESSLQSKGPYKMPLAIDRKNFDIVYDNIEYDSYSDFVMANALTVNMSKPQPGEPAFVNKYFTFEKAEVNANAPTAPVVPQAANVPAPAARVPATPVPAPASPPQPVAGSLASIQDFEEWLVALANKDQTVFTEVAARALALANEDGADFNDNKVKDHYFKEVFKTQRAFFENRCASTKALAPSTSNLKPITRPAGGLGGRR